MELLDWLSKIVPTLTNFWFRLMEWLVVVSWLSVAKDKVSFIWLDVFTYVSALLIAPYIVFSLFNMYIEKRNESKKEVFLNEVTLGKMIFFLFSMLVVGLGVLMLAKVVGSTAIFIVNKNIC
jgi:TctA family transporter